MPTARQAFVPQPVVGRSPNELRAYIEGTDPISKRPFMQEVIEGLTKPLDDEDFKGATFERSTPRLLSPTPKKTCSSCSSKTAGRTSCRSCCRPKSAWREMLKGTKHRARQDRRPAAPDRIPRILGVRRREGRSQRRDGGRAARILAGDPRDGRKRHDRALEQHHVLRHDFGRQWSDPQRDRHEFRHRRAGPIQPCQCHHRPRLQPAVPEPTGRLGARRNLHGHARQLADYTACFPRPRNGARGSRSTSSRASSRPTSTVSVFFGGWYTQSGYGPRETGRRSSSAA